VQADLNYNQSFEKWTALKEKNGNSYVYQTKFMSWTGHGSMTELTIEDGVIISRSYQEFLQQGGPIETVDSFSEDSNQLGTHTKGAPLLTIDDLYNSCAKEYLVVDQNKNTVEFQTTDEGLLTRCGFTTHGCVDDCYHGITITAFEWR
jgi:hypothetical protein